MINNIMTKISNTSTTNKTKIIKLIKNNKL